MNRSRVSGSCGGNLPIGRRKIVHLVGMLLLISLLGSMSGTAGTGEAAAMGSAPSLAAPPDEPRGVKPQALAEWDGRSTVDPVVIKDGAVYKMWYTGIPVDGAFRIGYATSDDGIHWTKYAGNPVLEPGEDGTWDDSEVRVNTVIKEAGLYKMWYTGNSQSIGYAISTDGIQWVKHGGNPVLTPSASPAWDEGNIWFASVVSGADGYRMWYSGAGSAGLDAPVRIGYSTSPDGITWSKHAGNPALDIGLTGWDAAWAFDADVIRVGDAYRMYYSGMDRFLICGEQASLRIGVATSSDGITWAKSLSNAVVDVDSDSWDARSATGPWVLYDGGVYHMWYHGGVPCSGSEMIGYATSLDGVVWTKYGGNPVLRPGTQGVYLPVIVR